jgi:phosphatidate cytidylyltransferase
MAQNFGVRTLVTVVGAPLILYLAWRGGLLFLMFIEIVALLGLREFYALAERKLAQPSWVLGAIGCIAIGVLLYYFDRQYAGLSVAILIVLLVSAELFRNNGSPLLNSAAALLGVGYVGGLLNFLLLIRELPKHRGLDYASGGTWVVMLFVVIWICDTAAYLFGSRFGRHTLFQRVSPKKTVEGAVAGLVFAVATAWICHATFVRDLRLQDALIIGLICGAIGQISDLAESRFKRDAGVKDSSSLIPGHGGVLDRFDSELLVAPMTYVYLVLFLRS